jgi:hypothetical protein
MNFKKWHVDSDGKAGLRSFAVLKSLLTLVLRMRLTKETPNNGVGFDPFKMLSPALSAGIEDGNHGSTF